MLDGELSGVRRRVVATVTDGGPGPAYPFAGLLPVGGDDAPAGFGLWIAHQTCDRASLYRSADGVTVRLTQRAP
ncbi:hypothetical protein ACPPVO_44060 [Dactylosporangium sp. McL0621]|uniref:hypothetical protein n=1 Tax=Dactylosporangium sp. McL0621 TaxID=3415678 RepID=UPI003CF1CBC3